MRKIKKGTFLDLILSDISEDEVRRTASKMAIAAKIAKTLEKRNMSQKEFSRILGPLKYLNGCLGNITLLQTRYRI
jgi:hypothetical protein